LPAEAGCGRKRDWPMREIVNAICYIREEIAAIAAGRLDRRDNPLKNAPYTAAELLSSNWQHAYSREKAAYPLPFVAAAKYWLPVKRVDNVYRDRHLFCTCAPLEAYAEAAE
jgi:glycine dehydrogenase